MNSKPFYKNIHIILPLVAIVTDLLLYFVFVYVNGNTFFPRGLTLREFWRENWLIMLQFYTITYFVYYSINYFNKAFSNNENSASRFIKELVFIIVAGFIIQEVFRTIFIKFIVLPENPKTLNAKLRMLQMVNVTAILVQYSFMTSVRIYRYLQQKQLEVVRLQKEYTQSQFEALKNQLNPHFLFNSLSVLSSLVYVNADTAETFVEKLSKTYRYLLEQRDKEKIDVSKEIEFLQAYHFLLQQRFGKKLQLQIDVVNKKGYLVPHSLLIAMEYIVSNNTMSVLKPLQINVTADDNALSIKYNANAKTNIEKRSFDQLHHLQERYMAADDAASVLPLQKNDLTIIQFPFI
jgi:two-component system, LytTR family, sensor kinase